MTTRSRFVTRSISTTQGTHDYKNKGINKTLGKDRKTLGKLLAECSTRRSAHGLSSTGEAGFAECLFSANLCRVPSHTRQKKLKRDGRIGERNGTSKTLPSTRTMALGKNSNFAECQSGSTRRSLNSCQVPHVWHSAKFSTPSCSSVSFACSSIPFQLFLQSAAWHTAKVCRVPEKRHSAKPASPVEERPCALRRVLHSAKKLPSVFRPLLSVCGTRQSSQVR